MRISDWSSDVCSSDLYLQRLPIDVLKIDRSFVTEMLKGRDSVAIIRAVLSLADALGLKTTAEGVETEELAEALTELGQIGRASCRERGCQYVYISVVALSFKKKKHITNTKKST